MRGKNWVSVTAASALLVGAVALLDTRPAFAGGPWGANYFPNVPLVTQDGETVMFYDDLLKGKTVAMNLIYTHCKDECPLETARLVQVQKLLGDQVGKDIFFYSISIDPERDTPEMLKAYAEKFHVGPGWLFLTGKKADIALVSKKLGLSSLTDASNPDGHLPSLMLGNEATGQWMRHSAVDNPQFLAVMIDKFLTGGKPRMVGRSYVDAPQLVISQGSYLFQTRCAACHTIGHGDKIGPDLLGVTKTRDRAWLTRFIATPDQLLAEHDPLATELFAKYKNVQMPNLRLGPGDVAALIAYFEAQGAASRGPVGETPLTQLPGGGNTSAHEHPHDEEAEVK